MTMGLLDAVGFLLWASFLFLPVALFVPYAIYELFRGLPETRAPKLSEREETENEERRAA